MREEDIVETVIFGLGIFCIWIGAGFITALGVFLLLWAHNLGGH